jgi:hypothetical protein
VIAQFSARAWETLDVSANDRSIAVNDATYSNFRGKLSITAISRGKQVLLSARRKQTTAGSRLRRPYKRQQLQRTDTERSGHDANAIDDARRL